MQLYVFENGQTENLFTLNSELHCSLENKAIIRKSFQRNGTKKQQQTKRENKDCRAVDLKFLYKYINFGPSYVFHIYMVICINEESPNFF